LGAATEQEDGVGVADDEGVTDDRQTCRNRKPGCCAEEDSGHAGITGSAPVQVIAVASDGFALKSLPGHPEGANRTIRFQFQPFTNAAEISSMSLTVAGWGPSSNASLLGPLNSNTVAKKSWDIFQNNIRNRFPTGPTGTSI
jgi:hypothetical protein